MQCNAVQCSLSLSLSMYSFSMPIFFFFYLFLFRVAPSVANSLASPHRRKSPKGEWELSAVVRRALIVLFRFWRSLSSELYITPRCFFFFFFLFFCDDVRMVGVGRGGKGETPQEGREGRGRCVWLNFFFLFFIWDDDDHAVMMCKTSSFIFFFFLLYLE